MPLDTVFAFLAATNHTDESLHVHMPLSSKPTWFIHACFGKKYDTDCDCACLVRASAWWTRRWSNAAHTVPMVASLTPTIATYMHGMASHLLGHHQNLSWAQDKSEFIFWLESPGRGCQALHPGHQKPQRLQTTSQPYSYLTIYILKPSQLSTNHLNSQHISLTSLPHHQSCPPIFTSDTSSTLLL